MITRQDLNNCAALRSLAESDKWELARLRELATNCTTSYGNEAVQTSRNIDPIGDITTKMADIDRKYKANIAMYLGHVERVKTEINTLSDPTARKIMSLRYVEGKLWEDVFQLVNYSERRCYDIHNDALMELGID